VDRVVADEWLCYSRPSLCTVSISEQYSLCSRKRGVLKWSIKIDSILIRMAHGKMIEEYEGFECFWCSIHGAGDGAYAVPVVAVIAIERYT
jgi:hypothetical protein